MIETPAIEAPATEATAVEEAFVMPMVELKASAPVRPNRERVRIGSPVVDGSAPGDPFADFGGPSVPGVARPAVPQETIFVRRLGRCVDAIRRLHVSFEVAVTFTWRSQGTRVVVDGPPELAGFVACVRAAAQRVPAPRWKGAMRVPIVVQSRP